MEKTLDYFQVKILAHQVSQTVDYEPEDDQFITSDLMEQDEQI